MNFEQFRIMQVSSFLCVLIVFLLRVHTGLQAKQASECEDGKYTIINDPRRSTANKEGNLCDKHLIKDNKWYRFISVAGGEMPTKALDLNSCGTKIPIWMRGTHPSVEQGAVSRTACAKPFPCDNCTCVEQYNITVRNCTGFYIYQLKEPTECYSAYCAGSKKPNCTNATKEDYCLKNRPPFITMPSQFYAYENSKFELFFNATDPEGYPLKYHFEFLNANASNDTITNNGPRMSVTISEANTSRRIRSKVTDLAGSGVTTKHIIEIVVRPCPCKNGGTCKSAVSVSTEHKDLSNFTCTCPQYYTGRKCEVSHFKGFSVEHEFTIVKGLKWSSDLLQNSSSFYHQTTKKIKTEIRKIYKDTKEFFHVNVIEYREGSVVVKIEIIFKKEMHQPLGPWKTHLESHEGNLGEFEVYANWRNSSSGDNETGTATTKNTDASKKDSFFGLNKAAFIALMCVVGMVAITGIVLIVICLIKKDISIVILCMSSSRRRIVPVDDHTRDNACLQQPKPAPNDVMKLNNVSVQGTSVEK